MELDLKGNLRQKELSKLNQIMKLILITQYQKFKYLNLLSIEVNLYLENLNLMNIIIMIIRKKNFIFQVYYFKI